jgi:hypothetical protein
MTPDLSPEGLKRLLKSLRMHESRTRGVFEAAVVIEALVKERSAAEARIAELERALKEADDCFEAALTEGLADVMSDSPDISLVDLICRRILRARIPIVAALTGAQSHD